MHYLLHYSNELESSSFCTLCFVIIVQSQCRKFSERCVRASETFSLLCSTSVNDGEFNTSLTCATDAHIFHNMFKSETGAGIELNEDCVKPRMRV